MGCRQPVRTRSHQLPHEPFLPCYLTSSHGITHFVVPQPAKSDFSGNFLNGPVLVFYAAQRDTGGGLRLAWYTHAQKRTEMYRP